MFSTHRPVHDHCFLDRRQELARLETIVDRLLAGSSKWLALLGPRKIGKTSLLRELERRRGSAVLNFVMVDLFEESPPSAEIVRILALRAVDRCLSADAAQSLEALAQHPEQYRSALAAGAAFVTLPSGLRSTLLALPDAPLTPAFARSCLELPEQLATARDQHFLIAIDEFQELAGVGVGRARGDLMPLMRAVWQRHERVGYVISGSARSLLLELVTSEHSPFFQHFDVMELGPFAVEDAVALLVEGARGERTIDPALARRAVEILGGQPFYLQLLGETLMATPGELDETALKQAMSDLLFSPTGRLSLYFAAEYQRLVGRASSLAAVLNALAVAPLRLGELATAIRAATGAAAAYVGRLADAVTRDGDHYRVTDPVFARWVAWRGPGGAAVPMTTLGDEAERRVADELARLGFDLVYQSRASRGAFDLLATRGGALLGVQVKRTALPASLAVSAWKRMQAEAVRLGWRFVIATVTPDDVVHFLDPARIGRGGRPRLRPEAAIGNLLAWLDGVAQAPRRLRRAPARRKNREDR